MFNKLKLREKVLFTVVFVSMISLASVTVISYVNMQRITNYFDTVNKQMGFDATEGAGLALTEQAHAFLDTVSVEQAKIVDNVLENAAQHISIIEGAVQDIYKNQESYNGHKIAHLSEAVPGVYENTWFLSNKIPMTDEILHEINLLSNLEMVMSTLARDPNALQLCVGTKNGLFYSYTYITTELPDYDPRQQSWYIEAVNSPGQVIFTDIYEHALGAEVVLTVAKAIYGENGGLIGVASLDIKLETLNNLILDTRVADSGYVFILDEDGDYIVHPDMGSDGYMRSSGDEKAVFTDALERMMDGEHGFHLEEVGGEMVYLTFSKLSVTDWSVGVVFPESEVLSSKKMLENQFDMITSKTADDINALYIRVIYIFMFTFIASALITIITGAYLAGVITKPIASLTEGVSLFGGGALHNRVHVEAQDEIGALSNVFNQMADNIVRNMDELEKAAAERERVYSELRVAAAIQRDMLTDVSALFYGHSGVDVYAFFEPALETGGDLYDVFFIDSNKQRLCVIIADISGKGVPAALIMVMVKTLIRNYILHGDSPAEALKRANNWLCEDNPGNMFVTIFISVTDLRTGKCQHSRAGHNPPAFFGGDGKFHYMETDQTMPLGFFPENEYPLYENIVKPGDKYFYYTDGITEALNEDSIPWGDDSLLEVLNQNRRLSCKEIGESVLIQMAEYIGGAMQSDDITMLVIEYLDLVDDNSMIIKNDLDELTLVYEKIEKISEENDIPDETQNDLCLCVDEIFSNITKYAYDDNVNHEVKICFLIDSLKKNLSVTIVDDGKAFNPLEIKSPNFAGELFERETGGLGFFLVSSLMDSLEYKRSECKNIFTMSRRIIRN